MARMTLWKLFLSFIFMQKARCFSAMGNSLVKINVKFCLSGFINSKAKACSLTFALAPARAQSDFILWDNVSLHLEGRSTATNQ